MTDHRRSTDSPSAVTAAQTLTSVLLYAVILAFIAATVVFFVSSNSERSQAAVDRSKLVASTTKTTLGKAPTDPHPLAATDGEVVNPLRKAVLYAAPGRRPVGTVGPRQMGPTWLPVIDRQGGWSQVLLPSRPNSSAAWLRTGQVERRSTPYLVRVHRSSRRLELFLDGSSVGSWSIAVGKPATPTPTGRTFLLGSITDPNQSYSPVILPLGAHSNTLDSYGGGPGTVAIHGWPDNAVFGQAVSHGCIRVPADALDQLAQVPLGTLVIVDDQ